jgi:hypothetical protein
MVRPSRKATKKSSPSPAAGPPPETPETPPAGEALLRATIAEQAALIRDLVTAFANLAACVTAEAQAKRGETQAARDTEILRLTAEGKTEGEIMRYFRLRGVRVTRDIVKNVRKRKR